MPIEPACQTRESAADSVVAELIGTSKIFKIGGTEIVALVGYGIARLEPASVFRT
jgi:histidinol dehydrogenase